MARGINRIRALAGAAMHVVRNPTLDARPLDPKKVLVLHELLLGDTLMLAPLLAALRRQYPNAGIFVASNPAYAELFNQKPYGVQVLPYSERNANSLAALAPATDCDIAFLPGENRHALAARAVGARWIVGFAGGKPAWRDRAVDELVPFPRTPMSLGDIFALLGGLSARHSKNLRYDSGDWPAPECSPFDKPTSPYAVLHVGAGSPLRLWEPKKWKAVAKALAAQGLIVVWTAGREESGLVRAIDPDCDFVSMAGRLDLAQLWNLLKAARFAVTLDTGIAHMAKLTRTPVATLFGPGSATLFGKGGFWEGNEFMEVTNPDFACRDQRHLFKRNVEWVRRCNRTLAECPRARCMEAIAAEQVIAALQVE
jgi:ADP-heptose:LPS heptosyltransferase